MGWNLFGTGVALAVIRTVELLSPKKTRTHRNQQSRPEEFVSFGLIGFDPIPDDNGPRAGYR